MNVKITPNGRLQLANGRVLRFRRPVLEAVSVGDLAVVLLDPGHGEPLTRNVYGVDSCGEVRWRIAEFDFPHGPSPYTGAYVHDNVLLVYNRSGVECRVDPPTGAILATELIK